jgi:hypothetical protein
VFDARETLLAAINLMWADLVSTLLSTTVFAHDFDAKIAYFDETFTYVFEVASVNLGKLSNARMAQR